MRDERVREGQGSPEPRATYRVQLRPGFGFDEAAAIADYLSEPGVSHLYGSPGLQAAPGSRHGSDVVDPTRLNEELGGTEGHRGSDWPERSAEYRLSQTLVGAWSLELDRVRASMERAAPEAKVHTSWAAPSTEYEEALAAFVEGSLGDREFLADVEAFVTPLVAPGRITSLAQTLLKLTAPGVPRLVWSPGGDWQDTTIECPDGDWRNVLTGDRLAGGRLLLAALLSRFPVALLERQGP
ncbi:MAG TPA: hypothetical protein VLD58_02755 [Gemmatimonadales bacterium]|nr:hypothetical protein [Gemmatimonadales bacterium]